MIAATAPTSPGTVTSVRGSVVDVRFEGRLPPIYSVLRMGEENMIGAANEAKGKATAPE